MIISGGRTCEEVNNLPLAISILIIVIIGWGWTRWPGIGFRSFVEMDGAYCLINREGAIFIKPNLIRKLLVLCLVEAGSVGSFSLIPFFLSLRGGSCFDYWTINRFIASITAVLLVTGLLTIGFWSMKQPSIQIRPDSRMIRRKPWFGKRQYSFDTVSNVRVFFGNKLIYDARGPVEIKRMEKTGEVEIIFEGHGRLLLGTVSGRDTEKRVLSIAQSVADAIGVAVMVSRDN